MKKRSQTKKSKITVIIENITKFINHDIWRFDTAELKPIKRFFNNVIKIITITGREFQYDKIPIRSMSMTYITAFSLVPILMVVFAVFKFIGVFDESFFVIASENIGPFFMPVIEYMRRIVDNATSIGVIGLSVVIFMATIAFTTIEKTFNTIWAVTQHRSVFRKITDYLFLIIIIPTVFIIGFFLLSQVIAAAASTDLKGIAGVIQNKDFLRLIFIIASLIAIWLALFLLYLVMPNTNVKGGAAAIGALLGTAVLVGLFLLITGLFWGRQEGGTHPFFSHVLGPLAIIPLMLLFTNLCWVVILVSAEIAFAIQTLNTYTVAGEYEELSHRMRASIGILAILVLTKHFIRGRGAVSVDALAATLELPINFAQGAMTALMKGGLVDQTDDEVNTYLCARDPRTVTLSDVLGVLQNDCAVDYSLQTPLERKIIAPLFKKYDVAFKKLDGKKTLAQLVKTL